MRRLLMLIMSAGLITALAIAAQPELKEVKIVPAEAAAGDSVELVMEFTGKKADIKEIYGYVREYPYDGPRITLLPDAKSKTNLWRHKSMIPWDAPSETMHLDFTVVDKDSNEIVTEGLDETAVGKTATVILTIK
jgi:hypothetical protein